MKYEAKALDGRTITIWQDGEAFGKEIWRWQACYEDGSGSDFDWAFSLATCKRHAPAIVGRYKRVKETK